ncbi:MAG: IPT/TIG domain-containing protein, partial [Solirubrobacteraceae bacterium]
STTGVSATGVKYEFGFTTSSATGALVSGQGKIVVAAPPGTALPGCLTATNTTTSTSIGGCTGTASNSGATETYVVEGTVRAGDQVSIQLDNVTNAKVSTGNALTISTTSDTVTAQTAAPGYDLTTPQAPTGLSAVSLSSNAAGATGVTYKFGFTTGNSTGALVSGQGKIVVAAPPGTALPGCLTATNTTTSTSIGGCTGTASNSGATETYVVEGTVRAGDHVSIHLDNVTNPGASTGDALTISTTSDTTAASTPTYQIGHAAPPSVSAVDPRSGPTSGGTPVTITGSNFTGATSVTFGPTAATNLTVVSDTQITASDPAGSGTVDVTVTTPAARSLIVPADQFTYTSSSVSAPAVTTAAAQKVTSTTVLVSGSVNPDGTATTAHFEYGLDPMYTGSGTVIYDQVTPDVAVGSGTTGQPASATVTNLVPNALYHVRLVATNSVGTSTGPDQTFMTQASAPPPPPVLGTTENVKPVAGLVFVKLPAGTTPAGVRDTLTKGRGFVPLTEARQLPNGSQVDARAGTLQLTTAPTTRHGKLQAAVLGGAIFNVSQSGNGLTKGLTTLTLVENAFAGAPSYSTCKATAATSGALAAFGPLTASTARSNPVLQTLHAQDHNGKFRTKGRYSAGTVRGTIWDTIDECAGTLTKVHRGTVNVYDFGKRKTVIVHAGHSYLAKAPH